jgi:hypothetical protein
MMMLSGGGAGGEESLSSSNSPFAGKSSWPSLADYELPELPWGEKQQAYIAETYPGLLPLLPWSTQDQEWIVQMRDEAIAQQEGGGMAMMSMSGGGCSPGGFYKVAKQGVHFFGLTNGTRLSGKVWLPIEVGTLDDEALELGVMFGGSPVSDAVFTVGSDKSIMASFDTMFLPNGTNQVWISCQSGFDGAMLRAYTNTVVVQNPLSLFDFTTSFGSQVWF